MKISKGEKLAETIIVTCFWASIIGSIVLTCSIIGVVAHFIQKYW